MGETFYSVLGVTADADTDRIRSAYRNRVKETHPDVSDNPDAGAAFKRVTTAREVLLDADERARYDRLGHTTYVRHHVDDSSWDVDESDTTAEDATVAWAGKQSTADSWRSSANARATRQRRQQSTDSTSTSRTDGGYATESWQTASAAYRRSRQTVYTEESVSAEDIFETLRNAGPWLVVYVVFVVSALTTAWFSFTATAAGAGTMVVFATLVLLFVALFSVLYMFVELHP